MVLQHSACECQALSNHGQAGIQDDGPKVGIMRPFEGLPRWPRRVAWAFALLALIPIEDARSGSAEGAYQHARQLYLHGFLERGQLEAAHGCARYHGSNPELTLKFQLLQAEIMVRRGLGEEALALLSALSLPPDNPELAVEKLIQEGAALTLQQNLPAATQKLTEAKNLCAGAAYAACGDVIRQNGILAVRRANLIEAHNLFLESLAFARKYHDRRLETSALANLGWVSLHNEHYDEAVEWLRSAHDADDELGAEDFAQIASGNLGWAYFKLGDKERALELLLDAEKRAKAIGNIQAELIWQSNVGYVYQDLGDLTRARQAYHQSLELATQIKSKDDIVNALEDLAHTSIDEGKLDEASAYIDQVAPLVSESGNHLDAMDVILAKGRIAALRRQDAEAEKIFRVVEQNPASQISMRLGSEHELARLYELEGKTDLANRMYKTSLATFESARAQLKNENSKLPFLANAAPIYDDYIQFLVKHGKPEEALLAADQSRARTLAQGLGQIGGKESFRPAALSPRAVARKTGATLLFYWLGERRSYLWAVTPERIVLFPLPARKEIAPLVEHYSQALLGTQNPMQANNEDGRALFQTLVAPALKFIGTNDRVVILSDGALTRLNFETLLAPGASPPPEQEQAAKHIAAAHYWIDDVTLFSAPSIAMLAAALPTRKVAKSLLLIGDPVSPTADFPSLPLFGLEMNLIEKSFASQRAVVFSGQQASAAAYLASNPAQYSYIHFVAHAVASRTDPLDSAIILSATAAGEESFKLYAREIIQRPIDARLVTISACYGSGTRFYQGEGLVGLSWAFLRAGAHGVIGALWEVSDDSTPHLMESLYRGLETGQTPEVALRAAKLSMVHSQSKFRVPFYWAPFQLYSRQ
jgi:CHAT domain-containing protein/tetratricopeptide (TPR) repeat protein